MLFQISPGVPGRGAPLRPGEARPRVDLAAAGHPGGPVHQRDARDVRGRGLRAEEGLAAVLRVPGVPHQGRPATNIALGIALSFQLPI